MPLPEQQKTSALTSKTASLFSLLILVAALFITGITVQAEETWHIKPTTEVPIRSGQGTEYKILAVVPDGLSVELLEDQPPWVMVRTPGGTEGWMLKRYLSSDLPLSKQVETLRFQNSALEKKKTETSRKYEELLTAYTQMELEYNTCMAERNDIREKYQTLQEDATNVTQIREALTQTTREMKQVKQKLAATVEENQNLKKNVMVRWFLAGGAVLLTGWIIGLFTARSRKKRASLY